MGCNIHLCGIYMYRIFVKNALLEKSKYMKGFLLSLLVFFSLSLTAQNQAKLCFLKKTIDLGEFVCTKDSIVKINFIFSNNGDASLVIYNIVASCGCVKPKWPKKPIKSGGEVYCLYRIGHKRSTWGFY